MTKNIWKDYKFTKKDSDKLSELLRKYSQDIDTDNLTNTTQINTDNTRITRKRKRIEDEMITNTNKNKNTSKKDRNKFNKRHKNDEKSQYGMFGWVSATKTKSYLLKDQAIDWLTLYYDKYGITPDPLTEEDKKINASLLKDASHIDILFQGGNTFERKVYEEMKNIFGDDFVVVMNEEDMKTYRDLKDVSEFIRKKNNDVRDFMNKGIPFIAQAPLINEHNRTYGVSDILIRSDYLSILFKKFTPDNELDIIAPKLTMIGGKKYHYRIIDCKWTTMVFNVDGLTLRNQERMPAYKGQLAVYTAALEPLQGYIPNYAYVMAKAWRVDKTNLHETDKILYRGDSAFDRPGVIDYKDKDRSYLAKTKDAIKWCQRVMTEGREWRYGYDKPSVPELYPNMNKSFDPKFDGVKEVLADRYGDPTMVWYVGTDHRENAHMNKVYDIRDPKCTLDVLGIPYKGRGITIREILKTNYKSQDKKSNRPLVRPSVICNNMYEWQTEQMLDYYIDFETINYNLFIDPEDMNIDKTYHDSDATFMIGIEFKRNSNVDTKLIIDALGINLNQCNYFVSYDYGDRNKDPEKGSDEDSNGNLEKDSDEIWEYLCLYLTNFSLANEHELFRIFYQFVIVRHEIFQNMYDMSNIKTKLFHWTAAEQRFMRRAITRISSAKYTDTHIENPNLAFKKDDTVEKVCDEICDVIDRFDHIVQWVDLCLIFEREPITVKGCYRFKLKHVGNAMYKHGLIKTHWGDGMMSNGFKAMLEAIKLYRRALESEPDKCDEKIGTQNKLFKEIIDYNQVDCRVMREICLYLRKNHCKSQSNTYSDFTNLIF